MLGSDYRELIVPKTDNAGKKTAILLGGGLITLLSVILAMAVGKYFLLLISTILGFATWFFWNSNRIEYEYIISGDQLTVTKIIAENKRKQMIEVTLNQFTAFGKLADAENTSASTTMILACTAQDASAFYADFDDTGYGQTRLVWTPNDDILIYLAKHLPRNLNFRWESDNAQ
ncbi:MAG: hypothetical protein MJ071_06870 [Oscillospiraceae bacterium]|nr:hypothetical protein [Oscillospiraceae bacterium]